jgi:hypothetical protein
MHTQPRAWAQRYTSTTYSPYVLKRMPAMGPASPVWILRPSRSAAFCPAWRCRASRTATSSSSVVQDIQGSQMSFNALTSAWWHCQAGCCAPGISALPDVGSRPHATRHHGQAFSDSPFSERTVHLSVPFTGVAMTWLFPLTPRRMLGMHSSCHDSPAFSLRWCAAT